MAQFKERGFILPIQKPILISTSGGVDSMTLAHLISRYGRKIVDPSLITLLHFDHQWRKESGTIEKKAVEKLAKSLKVGFRSIRLERPKKGINAEEHGRHLRMTEYQLLAGEGRAYERVLTAHHQGDVAETLLWRFLRGEFKEQSEGIYFNDPPLLRPFLKVSKEEIYEYAEKEKVSYLEDPSNHTGEGMRSYLRKALIPSLQARFPAILETLAGYATPAESTESAQPLTAVVEAVLNQKLNRAQRAQIEKFRLTLPVSGRKLQRLSLPGGVTLETRSNGFFIKILDEPDLG